MKKTRYVAGVMSALLLMGAPGVLQTARAAEIGTKAPSSTVAMVSSSTTKSYTVTVTAYYLNVRAKNSKDSKVTAVLSKGDSVTIVSEKKDSRGVIWGELSSGKGWINLDYTTKAGKADSVTSYKVKVTAYSLNVRDQASLSGKVKDVLNKGDVVTIVAEQKDSRGVTWGKLENGNWISLNYAKKTDGSTSVTKYQVKVTAYSLNVRSKASLSGTVKDVLNKGDVVTIVAEQKDSRGVTWGKLESGNWISLRYAQKVSSDSVSFTSYKVKVTADSLNIRKKADRNSEIVGYLKKGNVFTIVDEAKDSRGVKWGKLKNGDGWINLNYTKKA